MMTHKAVARVFSLQARIVALRGRHREIDSRIQSEQQRPVPDSARLQSLKRRKLWIKDELSRYKALLHNVERGLSGTGAGETA